MIKSNKKPYKITHWFYIYIYTHTHTHIYIHLYIYIYTHTYMFTVAQMVKDLTVMWETQVRSLGGEEPLEKELATHYSLLAWRIPQTEERGRLWSMGSQRVGHN